jgi:hypothetical protein
MRHEIEDKKGKSEFLFKAPQAKSIEHFQSSGYSLFRLLMNRFSTSSHLKQYAPARFIRISLGFSGLGKVIGPTFSCAI